MAGCILGAWLLALGIDLLVNRNTGAAYGLRVLLDRKAAHRPVSQQREPVFDSSKTDQRTHYPQSLQSYRAPLSTCLIFGLSWLVALVFAGFQEIIYGRRRFLPVTEDSRGGTRSLGETEAAKSGLFCIPARKTERAVESDQNNLDVEKNVQKESAGQANVYSRTSTSSSSSGSSHGFSTVPDSEIRALTQNYQRALDALDSPVEDENIISQEETRRRQSVETQSVPIAYRPNASHTGIGVQDPYRLEQRVFVVPNIDEDNDNASVQQEYQRRYKQAGSPTSVPMQRSLMMMPIVRADSDRGTTYSVPLTNITSSEYHDRDRARPPSWVGNLP